MAVGEKDKIKIFIERWMVEIWFSHALWLLTLYPITSWNTVSILCSGGQKRQFITRWYNEPVMIWEILAIIDWTTVDTTVLIEVAIDYPSRNTRQVMLLRVWWQYCNREGIIDCEGYCRSERIMYCVESVVFWCIISIVVCLPYLYGVCQVGKGALSTHDAKRAVEVARDGCVDAVLAVRRRVRDSLSDQRSNRLKINDPAS